MEIRSRFHLERINCISMRLQLPVILAESCVNSYSGSLNDASKLELDGLKQSLIIIFGTDKFVSPTVILYSYTGL